MTKKWLNHFSRLWTFSSVCTFQKVFLNIRWLWSQRQHDLCEPKSRHFVPNSRSKSFHNNNLFFHLIGSVNTPSAPLMIIISITAKAGESCPPIWQPASRQFLIMSLAFVVSLSLTVHVQLFTICIWRETVNKVNKRVELRFSLFFTVGTFFSRSLGLHTVLHKLKMSKISIIWQSTVKMFVTQVFNFYFE